VKNKDYPIVTLSYAQSLDGSIYLRSSQRLLLSCDESMKMSHRLRAHNDAILAGIGTILTDNPRLTVRLVKGRDPQPVVIDSHLRLPLDASVLSHPKAPWVFTIEKNDEKEEKLAGLGVRIFHTETRDGKVDLKSVLKKLKDLGIKKLMVEGGAHIITSFIEEKLADRIVLTVSPEISGGLSAITREFDGRVGFPKLKFIKTKKVGKDLVIEGEFL
jgi:GTP cyclohydrolase II